MLGKMAAICSSAKFCRWLTKKRISAATKLFPRRKSTAPAILKKRKMIRITGDDKAIFLQGMCTADVLSSDKAQYAMFLNAKGRVQNECLLYKVDEDEWLVECCAQGQDTLIQHLNKYKLRSKVQIDPCEDFIVCWSGNMNNVQDERAFVAEDPRTSTLGQRILLPSSASIPENSEDEYQMLRLTEGVAEGCDEVPPADCLPLEYNLDYMKGVSFTKGCYLGQELTARAHFTGVVRKRILPVCFKDERVPLPRGSTVVVDGGRLVGRVVAKEGALGLGLIKYMTTDPVFAKDPVSGQLLEMSFTIPKWWPTNA